MNVEPKSHDRDAVNVSLLLLRIIVGLIFAAHGAQKLFGAWDGPGLAKTVEQMAILEPVLSETVAATCLSIIREAMDEAVRRGVPEPAARDFLMGHLNIELAILFNETHWEFSAGCKRAISDAKEVLFKPDWKQVFEEKNLRESVAKITG